MKPIYPTLKAEVLSSPFLDGVEYGNADDFAATLRYDRSNAQRGARSQAADLGIPWRTAQRKGIEG